MTVPRITSCDRYISERTGKYDWRAYRYRAACDWLTSRGLNDGMTVTDIGAGWTEFDYCLRAEYDFRGRYIPIDGGIDGTDLNTWQPPRDTDFYVGLEIIEHLHTWKDLVRRMQRRARHGIVLSTPNPETTDVLAMDEDHVVEVHRAELEELGFAVTEQTFYGGVYSDGRPDALLAVWAPHAEALAGGINFSHQRALRVA